MMQAVSADEEKWSFDMKLTMAQEVLQLRWGREEQGRERLRGEAGGSFGRIKRNMATRERRRSSGLEAVMKRRVGGGVGWLGGARTTSSTV